MMFNTLFTLAMTLAVAAASPLLPRNTSSSDISAYLSAHNTVRSQHRVSPLTWSNDLATKAQSWANGCVFQHSGGKLGPYGGESRIVIAVQRSMSLTSGCACRESCSRYG